MKIFTGTDWKVKGLKFEGCSVSPFLCIKIIIIIMETFHSKFQFKLQLQISLLSSSLKLHLTTHCGSIQMSTHLSFAEMVST